MGDSSNPSSLDRFQDWMKPKCDGVPATAAPAADPHLAGNGSQDDRPDPPATEPIRVSCGNCGAVLHAPPDSGGKQGTCPTCANILAIPAFGADCPRVGTAAEAPAGRPAESPPSAVPQAPPPAATRSVSPGRSSSFFESPMGGYILLVGGIPLAGFIFYNCLGGGSARPTKSYIEQKFETFKPKNSK